MSATVEAEVESSEVPPEKRRCLEDGVRCARTVMKKRRDYLQWDEYFMAVAFLSAQRSKDPRSQVIGIIKYQYLYKLKYI